MTRQAWYGFQVFVVVRGKSFLQKRHLEKIKVSKLEKKNSSVVGFFMRETQVSSEMSEKWQIKIDVRFNASK